MILNEIRMTMTDDIVNELVLWICLILADFISGIVRAFLDKNFKSSKMREGILNKSKGLLTVIVCMLFDTLGQNFMPISILSTVLIYMIFMEACSIIENCDLVLPQKIKDIFRKGIEK